MPMDRARWTRESIESRGHRGVMMSIIGVTGGICCGKSTVTEILASLGAKVVDADKLGHAAYTSGSECLDKIVSTFGENVLDANGYIDRRVLGGIVFSDPAQMQMLNHIVWPYIRSMIEEEIDTCRAAPEHLKTGVLVIEAAVLIEAGWTDLVDEIWVVEVDPEVAVQR